MAKVVNIEYVEDTEEYVYTIELDEEERAILVQRYGPDFEEPFNEHFIHFLKELIDNEEISSSED